MAKLEAGSWPLPPVMQWVQEAGGIQTDEMHRVFNCGIGMVVVVKAQAAEQVAATLTAAGERVYRIGQIQDRPKDSPQTVIS
ncbi:MAG: phosphoribosylformylglycinamidine cyclo-ligase, partial [Pseudomonadota bacterium]